MNIVLFGDSLFGRFSKLYVNELESRVPGATVFNCATGGFSTRDSKKRAPFIAKLKADYVVISLGVNDCNPYKDEPVPLPEFEQNLNEILSAFSLSKIIFFTCPPVDEKRDPEGKEFNNLIDQYNEVILSACEKCGCDVINSKQIYREIAENDYHIEDGLHLNELGYQTFISECSKLLQ